jgi:hypothetical protein
VIAPERPVRDSPTRVVTVLGGGHVATIIDRAG